MRANEIAVALSAALGGPISSAAPADAAKVQSFEFVDPVSRKPLVHGEERVSRDGSDVVKHTLYRSLTNDAAQQVEDARYGAESLALDSYHFEDVATGELADVRVKDGRAHVRYREGIAAEVKEAEIAWGPAALSGKAIPELIQRHWDELMHGGTVAFDLYVPFRLETYGFRAVRKDGAGTTVLVEASNWLVRQVAPAIEFDFDGATPPRLVTYRGPSMVGIDGEANRKVEIAFR